MELSVYSIVDYEQECGGVWGGAIEWWHIAISEWRHIFGVAFYPGVTSERHTHYYYGDIVRPSAIERVTNMTYYDATNFAQRWKIDDGVGGKRIPMQKRLICLLP